MAIENVSGTAFVVAEFRAEENAETAPLYRDPVVELFLSEETRQAAERVAARFPQVREMVKVRKKLTPAESIRITVDILTGLAFADNPYQTQEGKPLLGTPLIDTRGRSAGRHGVVRETMSYITAGGSPTLRPPMA